MSHAWLCIWLIEPLEAGIMNTRRFATVTLCGSVVLAGCVVAWPAAVGLAGSETTGTAPLMEPRAPALISDAGSTQAPQASQAPQVAATDSSAVGHEAAAPAATEPVSRTATNTMTASIQPATKPELVVETASTPSTEMLPTETPPAQAAAASPQYRAPAGTTATASSVEILDECYVVDACVDRYLWALYQRTPKEDSIKESERRAVTVRKKHKLVTVTRTFTKLVDENFAWKDPKAADKSGLPMMDYVIGGMDRGFKLKLFHTLLAAEAAGLSPGITSAFRDDYRQSIASGLKAATDRSFHGGSYRGGYGHGLAADVVSVKGGTRAERWVSTENFWKWIDAHGKEFGIARPYLDRDPPHVAPVDGQEYAKHRGGDTTQHATSDVKKKKHLATRDNDRAAKHASSAKSSRVRTIRSARDTPSRTVRHG
jgi:hypothetical protein